MLREAPLGKSTVYLECYSPDLLFPVPRTMARNKIGLAHLPFHGLDIWNGFELSWLNAKGKPEVALGEFHFPCTSPNIVESKSFKLYLNSFNQTSFHSIDDVREVIKKDLSSAVESPVKVILYPLNCPKSIRRFDELLGFARY